MSLLSLVAAKNSYSLNEFEKDFDRHFYGGQPATSGVLINEQTAQTFSTVYACIRIISEDLGMMPIEIRKWRDIQNPEKGSDLAYDHPALECFFYEPNEDSTAMIFEETLQGHILSSGNGYAYKTLDGRGRVTKLKLLNWYEIEPKRDKETGEIYYEFMDRGNPMRFNKGEIFHIPGLGFDGVRGYSPIRMNMNAIGLGMAAEQFASYFYANGANVGGFVKLPGKVNDIDEMKKEFEEKFTGLGKSHKVIFLEDGMEFQKLIMPLAEAQFIETRKYQDQVVASIYRMPLMMLQNNDRLTYNNAEHQDLSYVKHTLLPWFVRWENSINCRILTKFERARGYFARFNMDALLRGDAKTTAEVNHLERQDGIITGNEWRYRRMMNPRPEPEADMLIVNGNMRNIKIANSEIKPQPTKQKDGGQNNE